MAKNDTKSSKQAKDEQEDKNGALFIPAGILTGIGVGFLTGNVPAGTMIGLGLGFLVFATLTVIRK